MKVSPPARVARELSAAAVALRRDIVIEHERLCEAIAEAFQHYSGHIEARRQDRAWEPSTDARLHALERAWREACDVERSFWTIHAPALIAAVDGPLCFVSTPSGRTSDR